ncbi:proteasome regulatory particle base subunit [Mycoemilia scoparia]|uniref:26S proteasome regulatory subunit RPN2 n=1 Tax=Mycoemilia scoparia TaxID=417184 RepID=A0A9W8A2I5_9FUNG|nr:proteasome regulatory particle base subunit [Mycoemilia scoparia]
MATAVSSAETLSELEALAYSEDSSKTTQLAALVASKVHFHCNDSHSALTLALKAGDMFDLDERSDYTQTVISAAIDQYIELRKDADINSASDDSNPYKDIVERLVKQSIGNKQSHEKIIGIALESKRLDILESVLAVGDSSVLLPYMQSKCLNFVKSHSFRTEIFKLIYKAQKSAKVSPDSIIQCLVKLDQPKECAKFLLDLIRSQEENDTLVAYQLAFDISDNVPESFTHHVSQSLGELKSDIKQEGAVSSEAISSAIDKLREILSGDISRHLNLHFLSHENNVDIKILENTLKTWGTNNSVSNNAICLENAFMHAGTTDDQFMRNNSQWLQNCSQWVKFSVIASLGLLHRNHTTKALELLQPYLPSDSREERPYEEAGAFFALGLICADHHDESVTKYLNNSLSMINSISASNDQRNVEILYHGLCLGIGTAYIGNNTEVPSDTSSEGSDPTPSTEAEAVAYKLYDVLQTDSAVAGQAAAIGIGLCMIGSADISMVETLIDYAVDTDHEKIIRGIASSIALIMFGLQDEADSIIERLCEKDDPYLRLAGAQTIAMAYCGTGDNNAVRRLLHLAVSDVNDDVRRAAATGLGFLFLQQPEYIPRMVQLLSDSFNPHVRYGAALALGITCAGTGSPEAISILEPMLKDSSDFVRQGVMISLALILIQQNEVVNPKVDQIRKVYSDVISDRYSDNLSKFGAAVSQGIIDMGGRNMTIQLISKWKNLRQNACAGMFLFTQMWSWFPLSHFISLALVPTGVIGVNKSLQPPKLKISCKGKKELFAYPPKIETAKKESRINLTLTQLSTTKAKSRSAKKADSKAKAKNDDLMELDTPTAPASLTARSAYSNEQSGEASGSTKQTKTQSNAFAIDNMTRVLNSQEEYIEWSKNSRYLPVISGRSSGIVVLADTSPNDPESLINTVILTEAPPPEPFEYPFPSDE